MNRIVGNNHEQAIVIILSVAEKCNNVVEYKAYYCTSVDGKQKKMNLKSCIIGNQFHFYD